MTTGTTDAVTPARRRAVRRDRVVPDQHGAWAFLGLPLALAFTITGWFPLLLPTVVAWVAAYPLSWALTGRLTAHRPARFDRPLRVWTPLVVVAGAPVLASRPWLAWVLAGYAVLWLVNVTFASGHRERSLANDLVLVAECTLMVPVTLGIATGTRGWSPPLEVLSPTTVLLCVATVVALVGSVLHVKSLIRRRHDPRYAWASRAFSVTGIGVVAAAAALTGGPLWVVLPFVFLASRCWWVGGPGWRPARVGLVDLAGFVLVVGAFALA